MELPRHDSRRLGLRAARRLPAATAHNFGLAGTADSTNAAGEFVRGGLSNTGKIAVVTGIVVCLVISVLNLPKFVKKQEAK